MKTTIEDISVVTMKPRRAPKRKKLPPKPKKKRKTIIDLWREWGVPDNAYRRYPGLRGIYWYWLSRDVRKSEWIKWDKKCLTCLEVIDNWEDGQCGHVIASHGCGEFLRFNRINLTIQHPNCNNPRFTPMAAVLNALHYNDRYGEGEYQKLLDMRKTEAKQPRTDDYKRLISELKSYQEVMEQFDADFKYL